MELHLSNKDYYKIHKASLISEYDLKTIEALYQPIMGSNATMLYFTFLNEVNFQEWVPITTHEMLSKKTGLNLVELLTARKKLEAIGLVKSYRKLDETDLASYIYFIYAPKTPELFFKDPLFVGLLTSVIGEKEVSRLKRFFTIKDPDLTGFYDVSSSYKAVYDANKYALIPEGEKIFASVRGTIKSNFDIKEFLNFVKEKFNYKKEIFTEDVLYEIERLATLFGLTEEDMSTKVDAIYIKDEKRFDLDELYILCRNSLIVPVERTQENYKEYDNDTEFAKKVNLMNQTAPFDYLKVLSGMNNPSPADISILNVLSREYGLSNGVINAIVEYTLNVCDQDLPRPYCEKLAAKLKRKSAKNAMEAINILTSKKSRSKKKEDEEESTNSYEEITIEELDKLLEDL